MKTEAQVGAKGVHIDKGFEKESRPGGGGRGRVKQGLKTGRGRRDSKISRDTMELNTRRKWRSRWESWRSRGECTERWGDMEEEMGKGGCRRCTKGKLGVNMQTWM